MPQLFFSPRPNPFLIRITHFLGEPLARLFYQIQFKISKADLAQLQSLRNQRVIYLVNHPSFNDPIPVMLLSAKLTKGFYYLASIEQFSGLLGWYLQRIGTYSVRRGQRDRPSIQQTLELLEQPNIHLVIFPEGGCSFQNDTVMPFRPGAVQLAFQSIQRAVKQGGSPPDCSVVPLALKYRYVNNPAPLIQKTLTQLETALNLTPSGSSTLYDRLRAIAVQVLVQIEADYGIQSEQRTENLTPRIDALRDKILQGCELAFGIEANPQALLRERTYQVEAKLADETMVPQGLSRELIQRSIFRLFNFNAIYDGYVAEAQTPERFLDTLTRLEREVFQVDRPPLKAPCRAEMAVGQIVNLKDHYDDYVCDRAATIDRITQQVQAQVQKKVDELSTREMNR